MSVRTWLIGVGWLLDVELSMVMMSPQSDKDINIRPRNQSRNVALYKHFEKGAVLRYPLGLCPRHSGRYRRGVSALPALLRLLVILKAGGRRRRQPTRIRRQNRCKSSQDDSG